MWIPWPAGVRAVKIEEDNRKPQELALLGQQSKPRTRAWSFRHKSLQSGRNHTCLTCLQGAKPRQALEDWRLSHIYSGSDAHHFCGLTVTDFILGGSKITADGDCSHEIKRCFLLGRIGMTNLDSILKSRDITLSAKVHLVKAMVFPVVMYGCESWTIKKT